MASKDKPRAENKKQNPRHDEIVQNKHEERQQKKHLLKIIRRRSHRTGHTSIPKG